MKRCICILLILTFFLLFPNQRVSYALELESQAAVLMEQSTGTVIFEKNAHEPLPMASISKIMTMLLALEAVEQGKVSLDDMLTTSQRAKEMGGTQIFLELGEQISLRDALIAVAVGSANDASVVIAEHIGGSYEGFIEAMNKRAEELGMKNTKFVNSSGLPVEGGGNVSSAYDIALMSRELLKHEIIYQWTTIQWDTNFLGRVYLSNTNLKFLRNYPGADGLKTGWTTEAGYCLSATAKRDDTRFIAVIMKAPNPDIRLKEVSQLLNLGFGTYKTVHINKKGDVIENLVVDKGIKEKINVITEDDVSVLLDKKGKEDITHRINLPKKLTAPLIKGQVVGNIEVIKGDEVIKTVNLIVDEDVGKAGPFTLMGRLFIKMLEKVK